METIAAVANGFMALFKAGGETFTAFVTGIIPLIIDGRQFTDQDHRGRAVLSCGQEGDKIYTDPVYRRSGPGHYFHGQSYVLYIRTICGRKI